MQVQAMTEKPQFNRATIAISVVAHVVVLAAVGRWVVFSPAKEVPSFEPVAQQQSIQDYNAEVEAPKDKEDATLPAETEQAPATEGGKSGVGGAVDTQAPAPVLGAASGVISSASNTPPPFTVPRAGASPEIGLAVFGGMGTGDLNGAGKDDHGDGLGKGNGEGDGVGDGSGKFVKGGHVFDPKESLIIVDEGLTELRPESSKNISVKRLLSRAGIGGKIKTTPLAPWDLPPPNDKNIIYANPESPGWVRAYPGNILDTLKTHPHKKDYVIVSDFDYPEGPERFGPKNHLWKYMKGETYKGTERDGDNVVKEIEKFVKEQGATLTLVKYPAPTVKHADHGALKSTEVRKDDNGEDSTFDNYQDGFSQVGFSNVHKNLYAMMARNNWTVIDVLDLLELPKDTL